MNRYRIVAVLLTLFALGALFLKLPEVASLLSASFCRSCSSDHPYFVFIGAGYFAALFSVILSFQSFPKKQTAKIGLSFAVALSILLTWMRSDICTICLFAHACHIGLWAALIKAQPMEQKEPLISLKLSCAFASMVSTVALFCTFNMTLVLYELSSKAPTPLVRPGQPIILPELKSVHNTTITPNNHQALIISFVSSHCPYCKEQLEILNRLATTWTEQGFGFVAISRQIPDELMARAPTLNWVQDPDAAFQHQLGITGFPSMIIVDRASRAVTSLAGMPGDFEATLVRELTELVQKDVSI